MCGIAGIVASDGVMPDRRDVVARMATALTHRGPDGEGLWADPDAVLGHRRLAIIDLSERGRQPICNEDGSLVLVCNGEIYNHPELRARLVARGHRFRSDTDVEVILHLYEDHGPDCVDALVGMFAFAIWDSRERTLFAARDRIGEKPFYYSQIGESFAFASEIKALLDVPGVDRELEPEALATFFAYPSTPAPLTFFKQVRSLPPASALLFRDGRVRVDRYWHLDFAARRPWRWEDALGSYEQVLGESVRGCLLADVPVGITLSGGLDSTTVALLAIALQPGIRTFCMGAAGLESEDQEIVRAQRVADLLGTTHRAVRFDPGDLRLLPDVVSRYDQPFHNHPMLYAHQIAREMRDEVKVVVGGNGADEVFGGYRSYNEVRLQSIAGALVRPIPLGVVRAVPGRRARRVANFFADARIPIPARRAEGIDRTTMRLWVTLFTPERQRQLSEFRPGRFVRVHADECNARTYLDTVMYSDLMVNHHHGHGVLPDVSGMAHGLEIRSPFLDHRVVEFAATLPYEMTVPSRRSPVANKALMRRYLRGRVPDDIVDAPKMGFGYGIRFDQYVTGPWAAAARRLLHRGPLQELGVAPTGLEWAFSHSPNTVWELMVLSVWADIYLAGRPATVVADEIAASLAPSRRGVTPTGWTPPEEAAS